MEVASYGLTSVFFDTIDSVNNNYIFVLDCVDKVIYRNKNVLKADWFSQIKTLSKDIVTNFYVVENKCVNTFLEDEYVACQLVK